MEYNREFRELHKAESDVSHYIVEDTFNGRIWRFETNEMEAIKALLTDETEAPGSATVHLVGNVEDVTDLFVEPKYRPKNWEKPARDRKWGPPDGNGRFGGIDFPPGNPL